MKQIKTVGELRKLLETAQDYAPLVFLGPLAEHFIAMSVSIGRSRNTNRQQCTVVLDAAPKWRPPS
jgi:hypothetical protein